MTLDVADCSADWRAVWRGRPIPDEVLQVAQEAGELIADTEGAAAAADYLGKAANNLVEAGSTQSAWKLARQGMAYIGKRRDLTWLRLASYDLMRREQEDPDYPGIPWIHRSAGR